MLEKELEVAEMAAREAGQILCRMFGRRQKITKKGVIDLVTEADLKAEHAILETIGRAFPEDNILSEEAGSHQNDSDRTWLVDPLDGTTNFAHGFHCFGVSIALEIEKKGVLGVVYNPYMDQYFMAVKGMGAYLNNSRITVSETASLEDALLFTGFSYDIHDNPEKTMALFSKMLVRAQGIRRPGSAALDLCYLASGVADGFWEEKLHPWDTAAGIVIAEEAGATITDFGGNPFDPYRKSIVAASPRIHDAMLEILNQ